MKSCSSLIPRAMGSLALLAMLQADAVPVAHADNQINSPSMIWVTPGQPMPGSEEHEESEAANAHDAELRRRAGEVPPEMMLRFLLDNTTLRERLGQAEPGLVTQLGDLLSGAIPSVRIVGRRGNTVLECSGILITRRIVMLGWHCTIADSQPLDEYTVYPSTSGTNGCRQHTTKDVRRFEQVSQSYQTWDVAFLIFGDADRFVGCNTYSSVNALEADSSSWKKYDYAWIADRGNGAELVRAGKARRFYHYINGVREECGPKTNTKCRKDYTVCFMIAHGASETQLKQWEGHSGAAIRRVVRDRLTVVHAVASQATSIDGNTHMCGPAINQMIENRLDALIRQYR